jgi:SAM-dependent methyltransferase
MSLKTSIPLRLRMAIREVLDRAEDLRAGSSVRRRPIPPAMLRFAVSGTGNRRAFERFGDRASRAIADAVLSVDPTPDLGRVLDFACGCGRVTAPLQALWPQAELSGVDIDADAIAWCRENLRGEYVVVDATLPFSAETFDVAYAVNVFTHMDESEQFKWLGEIHRVLRPSGLFIATTWPPDLIDDHPDAPEAQRMSLRARGFAFFSRPGAGFNERFAFHSVDYLRSAWSQWFELIVHVPRGVGARDLTVFRRV